jgi:5'-deoxynucleotidase YfbR-like HD superfamily hydrolase
MKAKNFTLADRLRAKTLERFHVVDMANPGNVAEHSFGVQIIAETVLYNIYLPLHSKLVDPIPMGKVMDEKPSLEERYIMMKYAQIHDLPELISGDTPTPFKAYIRSQETSIDKLMDILESDALDNVSVATSNKIKAVLAKHVHLYDDIMDNFELECLPDLGEIQAYFNAKPHLKVVAKIADILEAISVFSTGRGQDETQNKRIEKKLLESLQDNISKGMRLYPAYNWLVVNGVAESIISGYSAINEFESTF